MTETLYIPIWLLLSWLIRQIENGISGDSELDESGNETGSDAEQDFAAVQPDPYEPVVQLIKIGIAGFSILLLALSISAYKKTALRGILYASAAFGIFAVQLFFDYAEDAIVSWEQPFNDVIYYAMTLAIVILFFLAIVRSNNRGARPG